MPDFAQQVIIAANPKSGRSPQGGRIRALTQAISEAGWKCRVLTGFDDVRSQAVELFSRDELKVVISAGGDGTAKALVNLLPPETPVLPYPLGTENLLAKHLGISGEISQICDVLKHGELVSLDAGKANGELFLVMLSCGFDADVVRNMAKARRGHISRWSYSGPILSAIQGYRFPLLPFREQADDEAERTGTSAWVFVFNLPRYAARLKICPQADPEDHSLDVCTFKRGGVLRGLLYLFRIWGGSHDRLEDFEHRRCKRMFIDRPRDSSGQPVQDVPYQIDGDPGGVLPLCVEIAPRRLTLLRPMASQPSTA